MPDAVQFYTGFTAATSLAMSVLNNLLIHGQVGVGQLMFQFSSHHNLHVVHPSLQHVTRTCLDEYNSHLENLIQGRLMLNRFALILVATASLTATNTFAATVKQSTSGICHDQNSSYYQRTTNFNPFNSLDACLRAGGRLPKSYSDSSTSSSLNIKAVTSSSYSREQFGRGWADIDGDCRSSRHEALIAQSTGQVRFKTGRECHVTAGRWISPFTGAVIHDPSKIDIDHVVPLKWAWDHGANRWSQSQRERFANDPANLLSVEASLNRQKGAKGPDQWLPPANQCQYVLRFTRVMKTYKLELSGSEETAYQRIRSQACN
jgi:hypothetical protein